MVFVRDRVIGGWFLSFFSLFSEVFACNLGGGREGVTGRGGGGGVILFFFFCSMLSYVRAVSKAGREGEGEGEGEGEKGEGGHCGYATIVRV